MMKTPVTREESHFVRLYKIVQEREKYLNNEAKIVQYGTVLRYFMKFIQENENYSVNIATILYWTYKKLGDISYTEAVDMQDNNKAFLAVEYYNQALIYAIGMENKNRILLALKDVYYYLDDEEAFVRVELNWAENHTSEDKYSAYMFLAQNAESTQIKAMFLEKALDKVMKQVESFYTKYQDTLNICSQLAVIYELQGDKEKLLRIKKLRENTLKLLN